MEGPFHIVCQTCCEERVSRCYGKALDFFGLHAEEGHEVELTNLESREMLEAE